MNIPCSKALKMNIQAFTLLYVKHFGEGNGVYRAANIDYAKCLHLRTLHRARQLNSFKQHQLNAISAVMNSWEKSFCGWRILISGRGTMWNTAQAKDILAHEQALATIETELRLQKSVEKLSKNQLQTVFADLKREITATPIPKEDEMGQPVSLQKYQNTIAYLKHTTSDFDQNTIKLPDSVNKAIFNFIKSVHKNCYVKKSHN